MGRAPRLTEADRAAWAGFTRHVTGRTRRGAEARFSDVAPLVGPASHESASTPVVPRRAAALAVGRGGDGPLTIGTSPAGVDKGTWQRFRTGKLAAARTLDLHGMTAQHAFHALGAFLRAAHADRLRCVEIVTGRGGRDGGPWEAGMGVIRREFPLWLNRPDIRPMVLAAAHPHAANLGSVRLLLRRLR